MFKSTEALSASHGGWPTLKQAQDTSKWYAIEAYKRRRLVRDIDELKIDPLSMWVLCWIEEQKL